MRLSSLDLILSECKLNKSRILYFKILSFMIISVVLLIKFNHSHIFALGFIHDMFSYDCIFSQKPKRSEVEEMKEKS